MPERPPWSLALKAGLVAALMPLAVLVVAAIALKSVAPGLVFPIAIAAVAAGVVLARRLIERDGFAISAWLLAAGFVFVIVPAARSGPAGIAAGWLVVSSALVRLAGKRTTNTADPSVSEL